MSNEPATTPVISTFASSSSASAYVFSQSNVTRSDEPEDTPANQATFEDCNAHYRKMRQQVTLLKKKIAFLKRKNLSLASFTNRLKLKLKCAKERIKKKNVCGHCEKEKKLPKHVTNFINEQVKSMSTDKHNIRWSETTINICKMISYKSRSCYTLLKKIFRVPSRSTLQRNGAKLSSEVRVNFAKINFSPHASFDVNIFICPI